MIFTITVVICVVSTTANAQPVVDCAVVIFHYSEYRTTIH